MFTGFVCEADGAPVAPEACLSCARGGAKPKAHPRWPGELCPLSAPIIAGILHGLRPDDQAVSVTGLLACPRKRRLMQSEPYWLKPCEAWWAFRGQVFHQLSAAYAQRDPQALVEQRFSLPDGITGQPDLVLLDRHHLVDFKTTKAVPSPWRVYTCPTLDVPAHEGAYALRTKKYGCPACGETHATAEMPLTLAPPRPYGRHVAQVSVYRLLLWENGLACDTAEIVYQSMSEQLRLPVDLLPLDATRALLEERQALHAQPGLPDVLSDPDELWECSFCAVRETCERLHGAPVGKDAL